MKPEFNYQLIPHGFAHCLNKECKRANECLRSRAAFHLPLERDTFTIVNPAQTTATGDDCHFFKEDKLKQFARGMTHLLDHIPHNDAVIIKRQMLNHFGKTLFYRFWRGEHLFSPSQQKYIQQLFLERGLTDPLLFDEYIEQYEW